MKNVHEETKNKMNTDDSIKRSLVRNMGTFDSYLTYHPPTPVVQSPDISFDTLKVLENAEKLVLEARQTIIASNYNISTLDITAITQPINASIDENELYIRDIVTARFQEANRKILSNETPFIKETSRTDINNSSRRVQRIISKETIERGNLRCCGMKKKIETCRECLMRDENKLRGKISIGALHNQRGLRADIKPQLSMRNVERLDLFPTEMHNKMTKENVDSYVFKHEAPKRTIISENLVNVAVQTSIHELSKENSPISNQLKKSSSDLVQFSSTNYTNHQKRITDVVNLNKSIQKNCAQENSTNEKNVKKPKGFFLDFLSSVAVLEKNKKGNNEGKEDQNNYVNEDAEYSEDIGELYCHLDSKEFSLDPPNIDKFNKIVHGLDVEITNILEGIDKLNAEFFPIIMHYKTDERMPVQFSDKNTSPITISRVVEKPKRNINSKDVRANVKFLLKPRSRISSSNSTGSSEAILSPARFSTPLNNYYHVDIPTTAEQTNCCIATDALFIPITEHDIKNDAPNVFMKKNKFPTITSMDVNFSDIGRKFDAVNIDRSSLYQIPEYNKEKVTENIQSNTATLELCNLNQLSDKNLKSASEVKQEKLNSEVENNRELKRDIDIVSHHSNIAISNNNDVTLGNSREASEHKDEENSEEKLCESCKTMKTEYANFNIDEDNCKTEDKTQSDIVVSLDKTNPTPHELSTRDRTSLDVSAIYSESFEVPSVSEIKTTSKNIHEDKNKNPILLEEKSMKNNFVNDIIDNSDSEKKCIVQQSITEISDIFQKSANIKTNSHLSKKSNSNYIISNLLEKIESDRNTITMSSSSAYSLSSAQKSIEIKQKFSADNYYSEGELYLPSSWSHSLGEIRIPERDNHNILKSVTIYVSPILSSSLQSPGEILETGIDMTPDLETELNT